MISLLSYCYKPAYSCSVLISRCKNWVLFFFFSPCFLYHSYSQNFYQSLSGKKQLSDSTEHIAAREYIIERILIEGNKVTKPAILFRELTFKEGDTLHANPKMFENILAKCKNNLINTSLFTVVYLTHVEKKDNRVEVHIKVGERLYTWPAPIFELAERNFNVWWQSKDFTRTNYGFYISRFNFRGRNETLTLNIQGGFTENFSLSYSVPYISKKKAGGLGFNIKYSRNHEIAYKTDTNALVFYKTYKEYIRKIFQTGLKYSYRDGIYDTHRIGLYYNTILIADTITDLNPEYLSGRQRSQKYFTFDYQYDLDHRNVKAYPLKGYYFGFVLGTYQTGKVKNNFNTSYAVSAFHKYFQLSDKFYFSSGVKGKLSTPGMQAYYNQRGMGYGNDLVRGYGLYVIDGQSYGLLKTALKFELVKPTIVKVNFIPFEKFKTIPYAVYLNAFGDIGYVKDKYSFHNNPLTNSWLLGSGVGLDYVTYYDMVFRMEYTINKFGESGFFLNFNATL